MTETDTIAAISTPLGEGGIGIIRMSGPKAFALAQNIFRPRTKDPQYPRSRYLYYGHIYNRQNEIIDEVLVAFMRSPHTYTREDIVEINCHSGIFNLRMILELLLESGARLAEPGEFTKRAYLNGRIDLSQAESILKVIRARSEEGVKSAAQNLQGRLAEKTKLLKEHITGILARIEATLDYPEEMEEDSELEKWVKRELMGVGKELKEMLKGAERGRIYQEGIDTAIVGKPNAGKSSLLNALLRQQRAIVHEMPGTTRDILEGYLYLEGYPIRLVDTAGIRKAENPVEREGIIRSRRAAEKARFLIIVFDGSRALDEADEAVLRLLRPDQPAIMVINKADLRRRLPLNTLKKRYPGIPFVKTAAVKEKGIKRLEKMMIDLLDRHFGTEGDSPLLVSMRHQEVVRQALASVERAAGAVGKEPLELIGLELREAWQKLGEITGETASEELLDRIFRDFCLGK